MLTNKGFYDILKSTEIKVSQGYALDESLPYAVFYEDRRPIQWANNRPILFTPAVVIEYNTKNTEDGGLEKIINVLKQNEIGFEVESYTDYEKKIITYSVTCMYVRQDEAIS